MRLGMSKGKTNCRIELGRWLVFLEIMVVERMGDPGAEVGGEEKGERDLKI